MNLKSVATIVIVVLFSCLLALAQESKQSEMKPISPFNINFNSECGNPLTESQLYSYRFGRVIRITDDNKIVVKVTNSSNDWNSEHEYKSEDQKGQKLVRPRVFTVSLVDIDHNVNVHAISAFLKENILNQEVTITGNLPKKDQKNLSGLIRFIKDNKFEEVSKYLLENGIAKFKSSDFTNLVPMGAVCELERAEAQAKQNKVGIWAK